MVRHSAQSDENVGDALRAAPSPGDKTSRVVAGTGLRTFAALAPGRTIENGWLTVQLVHRSLLTG
jgi:hypothetical protein